MRAHRFTHANTKQFVYIMENKFFSCFLSSDGSTYVVGDGQSIIPVLEKPEEILKRMGVTIVTPETNNKEKEEGKGNVI